MIQVEQYLNGLRPIIARTKYANTGIKPFLENRKPSLGKDEYEDFTFLKYIKSQAVTDALIHRSKNPKTVSVGIEVPENQKQRAIFHPYSQNLLVVSFYPDGFIKTYSTRVPINDLRRPGLSDSLDVLELIGRPSYLVAEDPKKTAARFRREIIAADMALTEEQHIYKQQQLMTLMQCLWNELNEVIT